MAAAQVLAQMAGEAVRPPSQAAINWVRQQAPNIIPILGARREAQIADNPGVLDFTLNEEQLKRLAQVAPQTPLYLHTFWNDFVRRDLIYSEQVDQLQLLRTV